METNMAILQHSTLPSSAVHEPKHISINSPASDGKVITNSSSTTGVSQYRFLKRADIQELRETLQVLEIDASVAQTHYVAAPMNGDIVSFQAVVNTAVTTSTNTYELRIDGVSVTGSALSITVTPGTGGTAGDVITVTPSAANSFTEGQTISIVNTVLGNTDANLDVRFNIIVERT
jgi:hypothetical protein